MTEREILIENITLSEIQYQKNKNKLLTETDPREKTHLQSEIARDEFIIATWKTNYGITNEDVIAERTRVLTEEKTNVDKSSIDQVNAINAEMYEKTQKFQESKKLELETLSRTVSDEEVKIRAFVLDSDFNKQIVEMYNQLGRIPLEAEETKSVIDSLIIQPISWQQ